MGHDVVAVIALEHSRQLDDQNEQRHRQHEGGEEQVHLGKDPDIVAAADAADGGIVGPCRHGGGGRGGVDGGKREVRQREQDRRECNAPEEPLNTHHEAGIKFQPT